MPYFFVVSDILLGLLFLTGSIALPASRSSVPGDGLAALPALLLGMALIAQFPHSSNPSRRHVWVRTLTYAVAFVYLATAAAADPASEWGQLGTRNMGLLVPCLLVLFLNVVVYPVRARIRTQPTLEAPPH
jgi:peptidoglycan/LPS O-acetylase OafA/YrhL